MVPGSPLAIGLGSTSGLQPAVWACPPFPAKGDGSVALGFMVSLEDRRAGTWQPFRGADREGWARGDAVQPQRRPPRPAACVWAYHESVRPGRGGLH